MTVLLETNVTLFFGRFHSLIVHLPIGFIILAIMFELLSWRKKADLSLAATYGLLIGGLFGVIAVILGLMLASDGGYNEDTLATHQWTGIATTTLAFVAYFLKINLKKFTWAAKAYPISLAVVLILLSVAGHYGGNLTHGSTYLLEYAPGPIRKMAGMKPARTRITALDSALVYEDAVHFIFETKCNVCHNRDKSKGELLLIDPQSILAGGENGAVITPGDPAASELFRRVTLDPHHEEFMPTEGRTPLTRQEVAILEWWITEGAPFDKKVADLPLSDDIKISLKEIGIGQEVSYLASLDLPAVAPETFNSIMLQGFRVSNITGNSTLLEVSYMPHNPEALSADKLKTLSDARENITWLTLSASTLQNDGLSIIANFPNLTKLKINGTRITDEGIKHLVTLDNLEYLNLYGTEITDESVDYLLQLPELKKLYVWQTKISEQGLAKLRDTAPGLVVESGI
ncbi:c-type cytochrome domain-containing protein [Fulvivirgaceae bacterium BMA12]|uniref:C-type cytochrome domain-containing protein n=1 Tax=Agaribacillus aureus TaxID=3051825 RepID=A0ABT8L9E9_9BACT|nr:c-type cytochrome domain-containing protein [Fulvivirgaceae bacterium BMA12]